MQLFFKSLLKQQKEEEEEEEEEELFSQSFCVFFQIFFLQVRKKSCTSAHWFNFFCLLTQN
jgi:hypothetical protein